MMDDKKRKHAIEAGDVPASLRIKSIGTVGDAVNQVRLAGDRMDILVHGVIGGFFGDVNTAAILEAIQDNPDVSDIHVSINSPGGLVSDSVAIYNALVQHGAKVHVNVVGFAYSGASLIAMAGDDISIAGNGIMMIHKALIIAIGNADEMRETAEYLDKLDTGLVATYSARSGKSTKEIKAMLAAETYMTADEAIENGLADKKLPLKSKAKAGKDNNKPTDARNVLFEAFRAAAIGNGKDKNNDRAEGVGAKGEQDMEPMALSELKKEYPDAGSDFYVECLDQKCDAVAASKKYASRVKADSDAKQKLAEEKLASVQKELEGAKATAATTKAAGNRPGNDVIGGGGAAENDDGQPDPVEEFDRRVRALVAQNVSRLDAIQKVSQRDPSLHAKYVKATNAHKSASVRRQLEEKFEQVA